MNVIAPLLCAFLPGLPDDGIIVCGYETPTVGEMVDEGYTVVLAKWVSVEKPIPRQTVGRTTYRVFAVLKDSENAIKDNAELVLDRFWPGKPGDLFLIYGSPTRKKEWPRPIAISRTSIEYIKEVAAFDAIRGNWLEFLLDYLEHPDPFVANDAYREFDDAQFDQIRKISTKLPREKLHKWVKSEKTSYRRGLYGLMLGLCGTDADASLMAELIRVPEKETGYELQRDGLMAGYLLLKGEEGLKLLDDTKLKAGQNVPFSDVYYARKAVRFAWEHTDIPRERVKKSMRLLLDHPKHAEYAVLYLTHWKDWEAQDQVMAVYENEQLATGYCKTLIARYLLKCSADSAIDAEMNPSAEHARIAKKNLGTFRRRDPFIFEQTERLFNYSP